MPSPRISTCLSALLLVLSMRQGVVLDGPGVASPAAEPAASGGHPPGEGLEVPERGPVLDARGVEHLLNRFAFGAGTSQIQGFVGWRAGDVFDVLLEERRATPARELVLLRWEDYGVDQDGNELHVPELLALELEELQALRMELRTIDKMQFREYFDDWIGGLLAQRAPLRDRMTLFWHGFFPTSVRATLRRYELVRQHELLRRHALGSFQDLLYGIVRDAAMLGFFDNDSSVAGHPHENFARELLELYSLGQGHYTEEDVREAARALTGYQGDRGEFHFEASAHDSGDKTIFGQRGAFDGDDLVELILAHPACSRYVSRRLLAWMEGQEPDEPRVERYALLLRDRGYELRPWLRALATDPEFYRPEVVGTRIMAPVELLVSAAQRLRIIVDPRFVYFAATDLGQQLDSPPSVKGWDEGDAWVTSDRLLLRDVCIGMMLDALHLALNEGRTDISEELIEVLHARVHARNVLPPRLAETLRAAVRNELPDPALAEHVLEAWLAREPDAETRELAPLFLAWLRRSHGLPEGPLLALGEDQEEKVEAVLQRLAHGLMALPIAQTH